MGFNEPGARRCPYGCTQHFIYRPTDLGEPLVPDVASTRWSCIQICVSSFINAEAQHSLRFATFDCIYLLQGIVSGAAEANVDLNLKVNL